MTLWDDFVKAVQNIPVAGSVISTPIRCFISVHADYACPVGHRNCNSVVGGDAFLQRYRCNEPGCGRVFFYGDIAINGHYSGNP
ncbi:hypothetical protein N7471_007513 [Penicillium samsonianum]|uniref:uncharacterized protein n=1 Tax=Penicillium samsonianum TaxID=1882272 RepID=UPI002548646C|nr:uncharacterized protein N7471_007513 [Penicillium samsonianum]KAJ6132298.1 hypothetical protein N7471_007513 [Penicillium samsonianum]